MLLQLSRGPDSLQYRASDQDTDPHIAGNPTPEHSQSKDQVLLADPQNTKLVLLLITFLL